VFPTGKNVGGTKKNTNFFKVEITPLMSFMHHKMLNSASKCPKKIKVIKFSKPEVFFPKKSKLMGRGYCPCQIHAGDNPSPRHGMKPWTMPSNSPITS
jgi:hypothetical protein